MTSPQRLDSFQVEGKASLSPRSILTAFANVDVTPGRVEEFLQGKTKTLSAQSVNHLRQYLLSAFNCARRSGRWMGPNPVAEVRPRKLSRRTVGDYLRADEVPVVLGALHPRWLPLLATAIYTGLRKSELRGLRKKDVDLDTRLLTVTRSGERQTTKGGHSDTIPIAAELVPFLEEALATSPSELVFPHVCATTCAYQEAGCPGAGGMMRADVALESVLRRAMGRAGLAVGYTHVCRRRGCKHREAAADAVLRRCPRQGARLWPKPRVRPIRFHDLRHTTASLLMQAGAPVHAVQRILRHRDPRMTANVYGHLAPNYLRAEVDRLRFDIHGDEWPRQRGWARATAGAKLLSPPVAPTLQNAPEARTGERRKLPEPWEISGARSTGLEPVTSGVTASAPDHPPPSTEVQSGTIPRGDFTASEGFGPENTPWTHSQLTPHSPATIPEVTGSRRRSGRGKRLRKAQPAGGRVLTVSEVAAELRVSRSTVYALCRQGVLGHFRVANALRVRLQDLEAYLDGRKPAP